MQPRKTKDLIAAQALKEGIPEEDLWDMVNFYYKQNVIAAANLVHPRIYLHGLGMLTFNHWLVDEVGMMTERFIKIARVFEADDKKKKQVAENRKNKIYAKSTNMQRARKQQHTNDTKGETTEGMGQ